jgi:hypothetical protein
MVMREKPEMDLLVSIRQSNYRLSVVQVVETLLNSGLMGQSVGIRLLSWWKSQLRCGSTSDPNINAQSVDGKGTPLCHWDVGRISAMEPC